MEINFFVIIFRSFFRSEEFSVLPREKIFPDLVCPVTQPTAVKTTSQVVAISQKTFSHGVATLSIACDIATENTFRFIILHIPNEILNQIGGVLPV
jgi:hypothetical protein